MKQAKLDLTVGWRRVCRFFLLLADQRDAANAQVNNMYAILRNTARDMNDPFTSGADPGFDYGCARIATLLRCF